MNMYIYIYTYYIYKTTNPNVVTMISLTYGV